MSGKLCSEDVVVDPDDVVVDTEVVVVDDEVVVVDTDVVVVDTEVVDDELVVVLVPGLTAITTWLLTRPVDWSRADQVYVSARNWNRLGLGG